MQTETSRDSQRIREILADAKRLAVEYYKITGKPLGVTGEVAEYLAAETPAYNSSLRVPTVMTHYAVPSGYRLRAERTERKRIPDRRSAQSGQMLPAM